MDFAFEPGLERRFSTGGIEVGTRTVWMKEGLSNLGRDRVRSRPGTGRSRAGS